MARNLNPFIDAAGEKRDDELVKLVKEGNRTALEELIEGHQAWIYNLALRMTHHPEDAKDATQEVLIKRVNADSCERFCVVSPRFEAVG